MLPKTLRKKFMAIEQKLFSEKLNQGSEIFTRLQSEGRYQAILENIQDGYYEVDLGGHFTFFNEALCTIFGYPAEDLLGLSYRTIVDEETAERVYGSFNQVYRTGEAISSIEFELERQNGTKRTVQVSISLIKDVEGKTIGFRGMGRDVTEVMQDQEMLRQPD
jgi:PAS domain S-box-containing protein